MNAEIPEVLLVEDNPTDAELTMRAFKKHRLANKVFWVKDGQEALDYLFGEGQYQDKRDCPPPKVILLDLRLPKLDGIETLKAVKSHEHTKTIPVVILTSSKEESDIERCYELGVNSFISKPVEFDDFMEKVAELGMYWVFLNQPPIAHE